MRDLRCVPALLAACALLSSAFAQDAPRRSKPSDYPAHAQFRRFDIGAEYLVHNIPADKGAYWAREYLVVEAAIFPGSGSRLHLSSGDFTLRVNGKKILDAVSSGTVAAAIKYPDWQQRPNLSAVAGIGDGAVVVGAPTPVGRFPGDPTGIPDARAPRPQSTNDTYGVAQEQNIPIDQAIANAALPEGLVEKPVKGCLFFGFEGKLKSIRSLELLYTDERGSQMALPLIKPR